MEEKLEQNQIPTSQSSPSAETNSQPSSPKEAGSDPDIQTSSSSSSQTMGDRRESALTTSRPPRTNVNKKWQKILGIGAEKANKSKFQTGNLIAKDAKDKDIGDEVSSEENEFDYISTDWLDTRLEIINKEIKTKIKEDNDWTEKIDEIVDELRCTTFGPNQRALKRERQQYEKEREICREVRQNLEKQLQKIQKELEERKKNERNEDVNRTEPKISANSLFKGDDNIVHTILYVATFFPDLSPKEFKEVVSNFLKRLTIEKIKQQKIIEDDKTRIIETSEEQSLVTIWEKSFSQPDQYLEKCFIVVRRQEKSSLVIDFSLPYLRSELKTYFEEKQFVYVAERLKQVPLLLFEDSENVADRAIDLLAKAAVDYPSVYEAEWLLKITEAIENINDERLFKRLSKLICQMQIWLDTSQSKQIIDKFFDRLLAAERRYAFGIVLHLIFRHLCSTWLFNRIDLSKQLVDWLKQVLDERQQENESDRKQQNKVDVYEILQILLWQEKSSIYIYDLLEILKDWLPKKEISSEEYSSSNEVALFLLENYCQETVSDLNYNDYGQWPSTYPLFTSFSEDSDSTCRLKLSILASWLFYSDTDANSGKNRDRNLALRYVLDIEPIDWIGIFIAEWYTILCGQRNDSKKIPVLSASSKDTFKLTASEVADHLLQQVILASEPSEQRRLNEYWTILANAYLDEAEKCANSGEEQLKKDFVFRRKLVKDLRKRFQALQKETLAVK